jgi:hypothetical protein
MISCATSDASSSTDGQLPSVADFSQITERLRSAVGRKPQVVR